MLVLIFLVSLHMLLVSKEEIIKSHIEKLKKESRKYNHHAANYSNVKLPQKKIMKAVLIELKQINFPRVCFTEIVRTDNKIIFNGLTPSAYDLTEFFNQWKIRNLFSEVRIKKIENTNNDLMRFEFQSLII